MIIFVSDPLANAAVSDVVAACVDRNCADLQSAKTQRIGRRLWPTSNTQHWPAGRAAHRRTGAREDYAV